jgi:hypothetical protein
MGHAIPQEYGPMKKTRLIGAANICPLPTRTGGFGSSAFAATRSKLATRVGAAKSVRIPRRYAAGRQMAATPPRASCTALTSQGIRLTILLCRHLRCVSAIALLAASPALAQTVDNGGRPATAPFATAQNDLDVSIQWFATLSRGLEEAKRTGKPILFVSAAPHCAGVSGMW